jgi:hypothetical protein
MGAPLSDIIGRECSPNAVAPKEETLEFDPTSENSRAGENPLESKFKHPKGTFTSEGEAIARGDPENAEQGEEIADNDLPRNAEADSGVEETGLDPADNGTASIAQFANPSEIERSATNDVFKQELAPSGGKENSSAPLDNSELAGADNSPPMSTVVITFSC